MSDEAGPSTSEPRRGDQEGGEDEENRRKRGGRARSYRHGLISVLGRRRTMTDAVSALPGAVGPCGYDLFAVYKGQGGPVAAGRCRARLHELVTAEVEEYMAVEEEEEKRGGSVYYWEKVMSACFGKMHEEIVAGHDNGEGGGEVGSTALVVVLGEGEIVAANCGDSKAVLCRAGTAVPLSHDQRCKTTEERDRLEIVGRQVRNCGHIRFLGLIASSSTSNAEDLESGMGFRPRVTVTERTDEDEFFVLATSGLWDVISDKDACGIVHATISDGSCPDGNYANKAAALLAKLAVARGSKDNISVIVVELKQ